MIKMLLIIILFPFSVKSQIVADTVYANNGGEWVKYVTYRNSATTVFLPKSDTSTLVLTKTALADSLTNTKALINSKLSSNGNGSLLTGLTKTQVGLANVDNTSDASKPVSTSTQTAFNLKSPIASPTFTGTVSGITATMVGLGNVNNTSDVSKPISTATQTALNLKSNITSQIFITPVIGVATGTSLAVTGALTSSGGGIGYVAGAGGTVTQLTNKTTGVILNKLSGAITLSNAALAAAAEVAFTLTNSFIASTDVVYVCVGSVGTAGAYLVSVGAVANGSCSITVSNASAGSLSQAIVLNFVVIKGVNN